MAFTSSDLGDIGHSGMDMPKKKRKSAKKKVTGGEEMDAPSLMKAMAKAHRGKKKVVKNKATKKKAKRHHKKKAE